MNFPEWLLYVGVTLLVSTPFYLKMYREGGQASPAFQNNVRSLMFIPGLVALGFRLVTGQGFTGVGLDLARVWWMLPVAVLAPLVVEVIVILMAVQLGMAHLDPRIIRFKAWKVNLNEGIGLLLGTAPQNIGKFILNLVLTVLVGSLVTGLFAIAEEFGWRGYLQNETISALGLAWGLTMVGLAWGVWYAPLVLMGYRYPKFPRLGAYVFMPLLLIAISMVLGFTYWLSNSLWVTALLNASIQVTGILSVEALGEQGNSQGIRFIHLWVWAALGGICLAIWASGVMGM